MKIICSAWQKELDNLSDHFSNAKFLKLPLGIGYLAAATKLQETISKINLDPENTQTVDGIIFLGTAGSYRKNLDIGEVVQVQKSRLLLMGGVEEKAYSPVEYEDYLLRTITNSRLKKVDAMTSMEITNDDITAAKIYKKLGQEFLVENMELYGVVHVAKVNEIPCSSILGITNYNNIFANKEWENNHERVSKYICDALKQVAL